MSIASVLGICTKAGITLNLQADELKISAAKGVVTPEIIALLKSNKQALIKYLREYSVDKSFSLPTIVPREQYNANPLSFAQQRLWFIDQVGQGSLQYNTSGSFQIVGNFQLDTFKCALTSLLNRHEVLRTHFELIDNEPCQMIKDHYVLPYTQHDLSELNEEQQWHEIQKYIDEESLAPFDLSRDLMLRVRVVNRASDDHLVFYTLHHIACDARSKEILESELLTLYEAFREDKKDPLMPLQIQYADYALWQRNWLQGDVLEQQLGYWREQLSGLPPVHSLPMDNPRPEHISTEGKVFINEFSEGITSKVNALCDQHQVTSFMFLQTTFALLISRFSNQKDIVIGSPIVGRPHQRVEALIGFFINSLVLRTNLSGNPTFTELLKINKQIILEGYAHQHIPFEMLVEEIQPDRHLNYNPLYQIAFALQNTGSEHLKTAATDKFVESGLPVKTRVRYDLTLHISMGKRMSTNWLYNDSLFNDDTIYRLAGSFETLVNNVIIALTNVDKTSQRIDNLDLLNDEEKQTLLTNWNQTKAGYPQDKCLHQLFERQVKITPNDISVVFDGERRSYMELNEGANRVAHHMMKQGVKPGALVALCLERSPNMIMGMLAILKVGGAYVPLDPNQPTKRLLSMLNDCQAEVVLTHSYCASETSFSQKHVINLDTEETQRLLKNCPAHNPDISYEFLTSEYPAYVIYTSGTTGEPRGIMVSHRNVVNYLNHTKQYLPKNAKGSKVSSTLAFDATVCSVYLPLLAGKTIELLKEDNTVMEILSDCLMDDTDDFLFKLTPSHLRAIQSGEFLDINEHSNHVLLIGGEQLTHTMLSQFSTFLPNATFINQYGPSEATIGCCIHEVARAGSSDKTLLRDNVPIGRPVGNVNLYVLNESLTPQPIGVMGELFIGGEGLSYGYLNDARLTAAQFIPHPFSNSPGNRLYRTRDLVRYLPDGNLEFIERNDNQVKVRGYRIELAEVESQLLACARVDSCMVVDREDASGQNYLIAYVILKHSNRAETETNEQALPRLFRDHLSVTLPDYMVPSAFVIIENFPLTSNGKVDKNALPNPGSDSYDLDQYIAARSSSEEQLVFIWADLLALDFEEISVTANFFALGGHSLLATRLVSAIRQLFKIEIPLRVIFEFPTIEGLSKNIQQVSDTAILPPIKQADRTKAIPLSYAQQRLWFIEQLEEGSVEYNMQGYHVFLDEFCITAFEKTVQSLLERHEVLRTHYTTVDGELSQLIVEDYLLPLTQHDLSSFDEDEKGRRLQLIVEQEAQMPFDLTQDLMLRVHLIKISQIEHFALYTIHHIAADGWSRRILENELNVLYHAYVDGNENPLTPLNIQYADFALWQREWLQGEVLEQHIQYWREQLAGIPPVHSFPLDKPRPKVSSSDGHAYTTLFGDKVSEQIKALCKKYEVTLFMFLQTAFAVLMGRYSNETDIVIGTPISGRNHQDVEGLIGFFVNSLILRTDLIDNPVFSDLLQINKQTILDGYAHQHIPFEMLVEEIRPERNTSYNPLYQIVFTVQNNEFDTQTDNKDSESGQAGTIRIMKGIGVSTKTAVRYDLALHVDNKGESLSARWLYSQALFNEESISRLAGNFEILLNDIIDKLNNNDLEGQRISQLNVMSAEERQTQLVKWNDTHKNYPKDKCLHELFEHQAELTPNQIAVLWEEEKLTYSALNIRSNQWAHYLMEQGVRPGDKVVLCVKRSIEMVVGMLGILKAGGAYVPLDTNQPSVRLEGLIEDCGAAIVLSQNCFLEKLSTNNQKVLSLDDNMTKSLLGSYPSINPDTSLLSLTPEYLAYVIYTSGTKGKPKGVMVYHQNIVNYLKHTNDYLPENTKGSIVSSSPFFDATACSIYLPLLSGNTIELLTEDNAMMEILTDCLMDDTDNFLFKLTPSHLQAIYSSGILEVNEKSNHLLLIGGEQLTQATLSQIEQFLPNSNFMNQYGPTEATVGCCVYKPDSVQKSAQRNRGNVPIGRPISNVELYILTSDLVVQPIGVAGELFIGGAGLSQGYLNQSGMTAEQFIPNPFSKRQGERLYRTGDLVRYLSDGNLEFLNRIDHQVKLRGFRIELGEIEAALTEQEVLSNAVVTINHKVDGDAQLVAHVCPSANYLKETARAFNAEYLEQWTEVYDNKYDDETNEEKDVNVNFFGWNSSYTGGAIAQHNMEEWQSAIVEQIALLKPKRLLEIGCGGGLLLYRYGQNCEEVLGLDISAVALSRVQKELDRREWDHVTLQQGDALNITQLEGGEFDTVVVNSVVQYFPSRLYLEEMIKRILPCVAENGKILIGDVRNLDLFSSHLSAIERGHIKQSVPLRQLANQVQRRMQQESELLISPSFFVKLPETYSKITRVDVLVKRAVGDTEMSRYRYDVVLTKGKRITSELTKAPLPWIDYCSIQATYELLNDKKLDTFGVSGVPNARIKEDLVYANGLREWQAERLIYPQLQSGCLSDMDMEHIESLELLLKESERLGYKCGVTWSQNKQEHLDLIFSRTEHPEIQARDVYDQTYQTNYPQLSTVGHTLTTQLKQQLQQCLPEYMLPSVYITMEHLPLTPNGKIDKRALPLPEEGDLQKEEFLPPRSDVEIRLCRIWQELLNIEQIGISDNFFALGGHSLLATRLVSAIRQEFVVELSLRTVFDHPTISKLSTELMVDILTQEAPENSLTSVETGDFEEVLL